MLLFTLLLWLVSPKGEASPASHALLTCEGIIGYGGSKDDTPGELLEADSRGAIIVEVDPGTFQCKAWTQDYKYSFEGPLRFERDHDRVTVDLTTQ